MNVVRQLPRAIAAFLAIAGAVEARAALVQDQVVGPAARLAQYVVSPHGERLATILPAQGKVSVLIDGAAGPAFDEILQVHADLQWPGSSASAAGTQLVVLSADGSRCAYLARLGQECVLMVDGKERRRMAAPGAAGGSSWHLAFTGDGGKHVVFFRGDQSPAELWIDGEAKPPLDAPGLVCSRDGARYAYPATVAGRQTLIVDGADAGYFAAQPQFTADGQHLIAIGTSSRGQSLLADGQPLYTTRTIEQQQVAPVGRGVVTVAVFYYDPLDPWWRPEDRPQVARYAALYPHGNGDFVAVNGEPVLFTRGTGAKIGRVIYSADGRHYAAVCTKGDVQYVLLDGKRGGEYSAVEAASLMFSSDSTRFAYLATKDGRRYAVVDGKLSPMPDGTTVVKFSTDARHVACYGAEVVVDDQATGLRGAGTFSPDSRHFLVAGWKISDQKTGLYLDGRLIYENSDGVTAWAFSADSRHLYWLAGEPDDKLDDLTDFVTYVDGRAVSRCYDVPAAGQLVKAISQAHDTDHGRESAVWALASDGAVVSLGPVGDRVLRTWVHPPGDTTIASVFEPRPLPTAAPASPPNPDDFAATMTRLHNQLMQRAAAKDADAAGSASPAPSQP